MVRSTQELKGPIYLDEATKHHFAEIQKHVESLQTLKVGTIFSFLFATF